MYQPHITNPCNEPQTSGLHRDRVLGIGQSTKQFFQQEAQRAKGFESYFTIGIRGVGDSGISGSDPKAILRDVIDNQRTILKASQGSVTDIKRRTYLSSKFAVLLNLNRGLGVV